MSAKINNQSYFLRTVLTLAVVVMTIVAPGSAWAAYLTGLWVRNFCSSDADRLFTFTVTLSDNSINDTYSGLEFSNGVATFKLKHGDAKSIELPEGITYTVTQASVDGFITTKTGDKGTISTNTPSNAVFKNYTLLYDVYNNNNAMYDVNHATSDVTMTLCKDVTDIDNTNYLDFDNTNTVTEGSVTRPVEITLDLNGHKLSSTTHDVIWLDGGALTIMDSGTDGEISATSKNAIGIYHNRKLTINGGTIASINKTAINNNGISSTPGLITINGGTINANGDNISGIDNNGTLTINGGTITAIGNNSRGIYENKGTLTVNGGIISATGSGSRGIYSEGSSESHATITIKGGTISGQENGIIIMPSLFSSYVDVAISGGTIKSNADGIRTELYTTLTLSALPTFDCYTDISLGSGRINFDTDIATAPESKIKVSFFGSALPRTLTSGYGAHVKDANGNVIDPGKFFTIQKDFAKGSARLTGEGDGAEAEAYYPTVKVPYVDADGNLHDDADGSTASTADDMATAYILGGTETQLGKTDTDGEETWYVTTSETATFTNTITLNGDVHIILANGTTMNVEPSTGNGIFTDTYNLYIHGQQNRSGKLNVVASGNGIYSKDMNIYGAEVMAKSTSQDAIHADNDMNIFDAKVSATGDKYGVYAERYMNITGGQVKAVGGSTSDGIIEGIFGPINLTWKKSSDYLQSKGYGKDLTIANGQYFYMTEVDIPYGKQNPISGTISVGSINEDIPIGAKLVPALPVQGGSPYVGFFMTSGGWSLPGGVKAFTPQGYNLAAGTASLAEISGVPDSRTVILGSATDGGNLPSTFYLIGTTVENAANYMNSYQANPFQSNFKTSETGLTLGEMIGDTDENIALILSDGSFKSFNYPSSLSQRPDPQHVFLIVSKWDMLTKGSSSGGGSGARSIGIDTGATTGIKLTPVLSEGDGVWYSLDGRKLSVKPAAKGVYINKGKKYVVR